MGRTLIAVASDLHCNSTIGLCPAEGVELDDGGHYQPSKPQRWLWTCWLDFWDKVSEARQAGDELLVVLNGDLVDGYHHGTTQLIAPEHFETQHRIAIGCLQPALNLIPDATFVVRGTETHVGKSAQHEEWIAKEIAAEPDEAAGTRSWWHLNVEAEGTRISFAHHGRRGYRPWTHGSAINLLAMDIAVSYLTAGKKPPDLAIRSHVHIYQDSGPINAPVRAVTTPAWQLPNAFIHRIAPGAASTVGGLILECKDSDYRIRGVTYHMPEAKAWKSGSKSRD